MNIQLKDITAENFNECVSLKSYDTKERLLFEEHVASNAFSLAQAKVEVEWLPKAIYYNETMVGFAMYGLDKKQGFYFITRLMIDYKHQGKGIGKQAMLKIIEVMKGFPCKEIYTSFVSSNEGAKKLYTSLGFEYTGGVTNEGEPLYCLRFEKG
ncbi:GNAT family N-acetyltransferase [Paenibacillus pini]|uniref:Spermine/spermidine acetyltransferase n=1 Tax=Paenibacillus pini JCM 16418 TaxID=1236976 RepID=W7YY30_9BACL|nr:GNAT family N-acetyltransferase [Paenibacillus pini]GAF07339.1 spermine/spermidine acetyltransferase [Paenibacillus pini JCM 16418]